MLLTLPPKSHLPLAFAAGVVGGFAFAPWNLALLMPLSLALLIWLLETRATRRGAFALAWMWAFGNFLVGQHWIAEAFNYQAKMPVALGWVAVVLLSALMACYPAVAAAAASRFRRSLAARVFAFAACWMLTEWLRGYLFGGFAWNPLGVVALPLGALAQNAAVIGALGLSGLIVLASGALVLLFSRERRVGALMLAAILLLSALPYLIMDPARLTPTRLDIVQANIGQDQKYGPGATEMAIRRYAALSPAPTGAPRILIWPEAAIPDLLDEMPEWRRALAAELVGSNDLMLVGGLKAIRGPEGHAVAAYNSLYVLGPEGGVILDRYDKTILVPFGEYLPLRPLLEAIGLARLAPGALDFWPGTGARTFALPGFPDVAPLICYEVIYPEAAAPERRPAWLLNVSNDAWFSDAGAWMHLAQARLRSIEQGLPMARATPTGVSALIDPWGRIVDTIPRDEAGALRVRLPAARPATPFARAGTAIPLLLAGALLIAAFMAGKRHNG